MVTVASDKQRSGDKGWMEVMLSSFHCYRGKRKESMLDFGDRYGAVL